MSIRSGVPVVLSVLLAACAGGRPGTTPAITPGTPAAPRDVNIIARDYTFDPPVVDLVRGETVVFHVFDAGLEVHEIVVGDAPVQAAWEAAEAATVGAPPGPTPAVSVPPEVAGLRIVVRSGERVDMRWIVPVVASPAGSEGPGGSGGMASTGRAGMIVGCHIPGHFARGMLVPIRFVTSGGELSASP